MIDIEAQDNIHVLQKSLEANSWSFLSIEKSRLFKKLLFLKNIKDRYGKCYYGVKTALNDAFITPNKLSSSEHLKPILEGKEIKKWNTQPATQNLILFESKWTNKEYQNLNSEAEKLDALTADYPKIFEHLMSFQERAKSVTTKEIIGGN